MIGFTKLLCGTATVSEVIKCRAEGTAPPQLLQFSDSSRPLVVWNTTNRCNLRCRHCYISAEDRRFDDELTSGEAREFIRDLAQMKVPVLLFSGGEPLLRHDIFELGHLAAELGLRPVLSSNGTLITGKVAKRIKDAGFQYVGISIDGAPGTHDYFRAREGAFAEALAGIHACLAEGVKTGIRFTVNKWNQKDLPEILDIVAREGIPRFCMYHLVYAGRGAEIMATDTSADEKRRILDLLVEKTLELHAMGAEVEILTTDNHADGVYLKNYIEKHYPQRAPEVLTLLDMHGGCSAGTKFANVDPRGNVHPCQFWQDYNLGNVRETPFSQLWTGDDQLLVQLRNKRVHLKGKCGRCQHNSVCGGCRIRARAAHGDVWAEDPACYLEEDEING
ncbi:radical SAM/SPASM domain-containing protein [Syntrophothermus lipocalidus]|uniref:Mycofactocin maturase MftC n=1 Tax=Syntrophothermus lipocalidus (strain DSM 12680 / TGB-C1) TaxID=643648 RepID=D7CNA3_SYNLT|nr:radical SAM protein [Syntrophothermus lipocalidus]ADI02188.1 Radical SAM domain protein [Syntrophothermus lipocalidus DSM 12680]HOV42714.1 radical SAM protein [Syntrophothermus lipocalidus]